MLISCEVNSYQSIVIIVYYWEHSHSTTQKVYLYTQVLSVWGNNTNTSCLGDLILTNSSKVEMACPFLKYGANP